MSKQPFLFNLERKGTLMNIKYVKTNSNCDCPVYKTIGSAGCDITSIEQRTLYPGNRQLFRTGLKFEIPLGFEGQIRSRSGLALNHGIIVLNTPGTIDSDYRGEINVLLYHSGNKSDRPYTITIGERIAQIVFNKVKQATFELVEELDFTVRGVNGWGSTG